MNKELLLTAADSVVAERYRQHEKWGEQRHSHEYWLTILIEEVGELAQAIQKAKGDGKETDADNLLEESIHVAAVSLAIVEQIIEEVEGANNLESGTEEAQPETDGDFPFSFEESETSGPDGGEGTT